MQLARSVEKLRADLLKQQERDLNRAKRFEKAGMIAKIERMSAQVNRDAAERDFIGSQTDRKVAETELADLLREETIGKLDTPMFVTKNLKTLSYWQDLALANNPTLKALEAQHEQIGLPESASVLLFGTTATARHASAALRRWSIKLKQLKVKPEMRSTKWLKSLGLRATKLWNNIV